MSGAAKPGQPASRLGAIVHSSPASPNFRAGIAVHYIWEQLILAGLFRSSAQYLLRNTAEKSIHESSAVAQFSTSCRLQIRVSAGRTMYLALAASHFGWFWPGPRGLRIRREPTAIAGGSGCPGKTWR
jgi:hypothetical protein